MTDVTTKEPSVSVKHQDRVFIHPAERWHADHRNYAQLLDLLEQQIASMHRGGRPQYRLMASIVDYLHHFPDRFHHPREDVAFERMVQRDPQLQLGIARRMQEHVAIAAAGEELLNRLNQAAAGAVTNRSALEAAAAMYLVYYRHHLAAEEREVIPCAMQLLQPADWNAVAAIPSEPDPVFGAGVDERYRPLRQRIAEQSRSKSDTGKANPK